MSDTLFFGNHELKLDDPSFVFKLRSPFKSILSILNLLFGILSCGAIFLMTPLCIMLNADSIYPLGGVLGTLIPFIFINIFYNNYEGSYLVDNKRKVVEYLVKILDVQVAFSVCTFEEIHCVTINSCVRGRGNSQFSSEVYFLYTVVLVTKAGKIIDISDTYANSLSEYHKVASRLAEHFGTDFKEGEEAGQVACIFTGENKELTVVHQTATVNM